MSRQTSFIYYLLITAIAGGLGLIWALDRITFFAPYWLIALVVLPLFVRTARSGISGLPPATNLVTLLLRGLTVMVVIVALADIRLVKKNDTLCVFFALDHSASVPAPILDKALQYVNAATERKASHHDLAGVVVFGETAGVEIVPTPSLKAERIYSATSKDFTSIEAATKLAAAAFPADSRKKIVLITDGNENLGDAVAAAEYAAANQIVIDALPVSYDYAQEVLLKSIRLPEKVHEGEPFEATIRLESIQASEGMLTVYVDGQVAVNKPISIKPGPSNIYRTTLTISEPGMHTVTARVSSPNDTVSENNSVSTYAHISGPSRALFVTNKPDETQFLAAIAKQEHVDVDHITPNGVPSRLEDVQNYDFVVLANCNADLLTMAQMETIRRHVHDLGAGLILTGGNESFGVGNYGDTPIERASPVLMEIKDKKRRPKGALVLILHTVEISGPEQGDHWAREISKEAVRQVKPEDEVGVLYFEQPGGDRWLFELQPAGDKSDMYRLLDTVQPKDMPSFATTLAMAYQGLKKSDAAIRHMIIISDGDPSKPADQLVQKIAAANMSISTVAINPHSPRDVDIMEELAARTGGRYYFVEDANHLPQIFAREAKVVKRSMIFNEAFRPIVDTPSELTRNMVWDNMPFLHAYVATTAKDSARVPLISSNENHDPVLAHWRYGLGKAVAFTSDAGLNWSRRWLSWPGYGQLWSRTFRWATRQREEKNLNMRTRIDGRQARIVIDAMGDDGRYLNFLKLDGRVLSRGRTTPLAIKQSAPGRYEAEFETKDVGVNLISIAYEDPSSGRQGYIASGVSVPYSPEFQHLTSNRPLLDTICQRTGGKLLTGEPAVDNVFVSDQEPIRSFRPIWESLLWLGLALLVIDITLRRVIIRGHELQAIWRRFGAQAGTKDQSQQATPTATATNVESTATETTEPLTPIPTSSESTPASVESEEEAPEAQDDSYTSRLLAAKKRAHQRGVDKDEQA